MKPLQDTSIFTIKASDLSAGVRGTAVFTQKTDSGATIEVIDSTTGTGSAVEVTVQTASGILVEDLKVEESLKIGNNRQEKVKLNMDQLLQRENMRNHLKSDILLMNHMLNAFHT